MTLRTEGGLSGFPKRSESEYDCFGAGHSSTSISAALGFACASKMMGLDEKVIALIGDGAMTGGLAFEGLNNAGAGNADLLILLNDNNQSIDGNIGAMHEHLLKLSTSTSYNSFKESVWTALGEGKFRRFLQRWIRSLKSWIVKRTGGDVFESLGFRYFGPVDGNNIEEVVSALRRLSDIKGPRILHCLTVKGKGYPAAEKDPTTWHAPGKFNPQTAERISEPHLRDRYQDVFGEVLCELAAMDPKVVGITPAMAQGCGMTRLAAERPGQFFDVGIEEEHAVTFAAGLAAAGMKPLLQHLLLLRAEGIRRGYPRRRPPEPAGDALPRQGGARGRGRRHAPRHIRPGGVPLHPQRDSLLPQGRDRTQEPDVLGMAQQDRPLYNKVPARNGRRC